MSTTHGLSKFKAHVILLRNRLLIKICAGEYGNPATGVFRYYWCIRYYLVLFDSI